MILEHRIIEPLRGGSGFVEMEMLVTFDGELLDELLEDKVDFPDTPLPEANKRLLRYESILEGFPYSCVSHSLKEMRYDADKGVLEVSIDMALDEVRHAAFMKSFEALLSEDSEEPPIEFSMEIIPGFFGSDNIWPGEGPWDYAKIGNRHKSDEWKKQYEAVYEKYRENSSSYFVIFTSPNYDTLRIMQKCYKLDRELISFLNDFGGFQPVNMPRMTVDILDSDGRIAMTAQEVLPVPSAKGEVYPYLVQDTSYGPNKYRSNMGYAGKIAFTYIWRLDASPDEAARAAKAVFSVGFTEAERR